MGIRNCSEIGENLQLIIQRLMANDNLCKYLYYTNKDPLNNPELTEEQKRKEIFNKLIKIVPCVKDLIDGKSVIAIRVVSGNTTQLNSEFKTVVIGIESFCPLDSWLIKGDNLRPFAILGEIQKSLDNKTVNGLGKIEGGNFKLKFLTENTSDYEQLFSIVTYD